MRERTPSQPSQRLPKDGIGGDAAALADQAESLFRAFRVVRRRVLARPIGMAGLPGAHLELLNLVRRYPGVRTREAARHLHLASNTVSTLASHLDDAGLLERRRDDTDGRGVRLYLTAAAVDELTDWRDQRLGLLTQALSALEPADRAQIIATLPALERLVDTVRDQVSPPEPPQPHAHRHPPQQPPPATPTEANRREPEPDDRPPPKP